MGRTAPASDTPQTKVTVVVNGHREGLLIQSAIASAELAMHRARGAGIQSELLVVLDRPDRRTHELLRARPDLDVHTVTFGDLGMSRNYAAQTVSSEFLAFLDADDLLDPDWLVLAVTDDLDPDRQVVLHPEVVIGFGSVASQVRQLSSTDPNFRKEHLILHNYWISQVLVSAQVLRSYPYPITNLEQGLGFEDWGWNCKTLAAGVVHEVVPRSCAFIRKQAHSLSVASAAMNVFPDYGGLFSQRQADPSSAAFGGGRRCTKEVAG